MRKINRQYFEYRIAWIFWWEKFLNRVWDLYQYAVNDKMKREKWRITEWRWGNGDTFISEKEKIRIFMEDEDLRPERQEFEGGRFDAVTWNLQLIDKTF